MNGNTAAPAPGWYPASHANNEQRYWDGTRWTDWTPESAAQHTLPIPAPTAPGIAPPPATAFPVTSAPPPPDGTKRKWIIGGAVATVVIVVGSIGAAIGRGGSDGPAEVAQPAPTVTVTEAPPEVVVEEVVDEEPAPAAPVDADPVAFRAQANSHLDDMNKDLDDIVVTVQEQGFWRLLSNSIELSFNLGQLEALDPPASGASTWPASLLQLESSLDTLTNAIDTQDGPTILAAVDGVRTQVTTTRAVAEAVQ